MTSHWRKWVQSMLLGTALLSGPAQVFASEYLIGTYYFPGWTAGAKGLAYPDPWRQIQKFPEKEPLLGWYSDSDPKVLRQQTQWMRNNGIGFVAFDWYWDGKNTYMEHALNAFRASKTTGEMKFTVLWANHYKFPGGLPEYQLMVSYWVAQYFSDPDFLRIEGKPVVFVFAVDAFADAAKTIGVSPARLIEVANDIAQKAGLPGIYFVGGTPALEHWSNAVAPTAGFSGLSAYNYHKGYSGNALTESTTGTGYLRLDTAYRKNWQWLFSRSPLPYFIPMTSGWDKRPWGGSKDASTDQSISTPDQFESHLREAKRFMDSNLVKSKKLGVICCWNEFGEGSYIEPTKKDGFSYLERVKKVFGAQ